MSDITITKVEFAPGNLKYRQEIKNSEDVLRVLAEADMKQGYAAFSKGEIRLPDAGLVVNADLLNERTALKDCDGYLMELNLWKNEGTIFEEIAVERTDEGFLTQEWKLDISEIEQGNCWYRFRKHPVLENSRLYKDKIETIETIMPKHRLHFFITRSTDNKTGEV